jgi:hypothetical protein
VLEDGSLHLLTNERESEAALRLLISSADPVRIEAWDPETGERRTLAEHAEAEDATRVGLMLAPGQALFVVAMPPGSVEAPGAAGGDLSEERLLGTFGLPRPVEGWEIREGDVAELKALPSIAEDTPLTEEGRWDLIPGCEHFSGTMEYRLEFEAPADWARVASAIALDNVRYVADAKLNGEPLGALIWAPYRWDTTGLLREGRNELVVRVTNTLANATLKPEVMEEAKARGWWNTYRERSQPMMEESLPSGVSPVVSILLGD